ncbi:hypothetical protein QAD02_017270 [Eretmocerus hayati]|uniref:Uncharacterized protein n=1 Tax=Eretmocerus hayati TaxID=131215 RepID=A0ACC2PEF1_9HYME|nr:hypothetical protein QAD02_017270 [Eretmocerus hayati]
MSGPDLPLTPMPLKSLQPFLKIAQEHDQRDPVVSYWCRLYALQSGLKLSTKTGEETSFLLKLMDWLENTKKLMHDNEAITNDVAAQAHLENWALKLFLFADKNDREENFGKNVIQSFYTAGLLYDVLTTFGDLSEEAMQNRKYAKWKAAYIHNCLKNGGKPLPGPATHGADEDPTPGGPASPTQPSSAEPSSGAGAFNFPSVPDPQSYNVVPMPIANPETKSREPYEDKTQIAKTDGGVELTVEQTSRAQKYIKWAGGALNYDDIPTAITNLKKALHLLSTGEDPN